MASETDIGGMSFETDDTANPSDIGAFRAAPVEGVGDAGVMTLMTGYWGATINE